MCVPFANWFIKPFFKIKVLRRSSVKLRGRRGRGCARERREERCGSILLPRGLNLHTMSAKNVPESKSDAAFDLDSEEARQSAKYHHKLSMRTRDKAGMGSLGDSGAAYLLLKHEIQLGIGGLAQLVDPARQAQNAAEAAARIADLEAKVASAAEIGAAAQPVLDALERVEARLAALEARPQGGCCVVS